MIYPPPPHPLFFADFPMGSYVIDYSFCSAYTATAQAVTVIGLSRLSCPTPLNPLLLVFSLAPNSKIVFFCEGSSSTPATQAPPNAGGISVSGKLGAIQEGFTHLRYCSYPIPFSSPRFVLLSSS